MHTHSRKLYHLGDYCCSHYILSCEHPDLMEFEFATPLIQTFVIHTIVVWVRDDTNFMSVTIKGCPDRQIWELGCVVLCECWWWWHRWLMVVALTMMTKNVAAENKASKLAWLWDFWGTNKKKDWGRSSPSAATQSALRGTKPMISCCKKLPSPSPPPWWYWLCIYPQDVWRYSQPTFCCNNHTKLPGANTHPVAEIVPITVHSTHLLSLDNWAVQRSVLLSNFPPPLQGGPPFIANVWL